MKWNQLETLEQLDGLDEASVKAPLFILKHSTRCSISAMALDRLQRKWTEKEVLSPWYLDLLRHRELSNAIETRYAVTHESPQVLLIRNGRCVYHASHSDIVYEELLAAAAQ